MKTEDRLARAALQAILSVREHWAEQLRLERIVEDEALALAHAEKRPLVNHYWQARYLAEERLRAIDRIIEAIHETSSPEIK